MEDFKGPGSNRPADTSRNSDVVGTQNATSFELKDEQKARYETFSDTNKLESPSESQIKSLENTDHDREKTTQHSIRSIPSSRTSISSTTSTKHPSTSTNTEPPYNVFTFAKKKRLINLISLASLFTSLSNSIYFPALGQISRDLNVSMSLLNLTITVYLVVQAMSPSFWGPLSDAKGRRIAYIGAQFIFLGSNLGLAFTQKFAQLMAFRAIVGMTATVSVGNGLIGDITTPRERGGLVGIYDGVRMVGESIGPVFGGILSQYLGFRSVFWFMFGCGLFTTLLLVLFLPETLRSIAGNGTIRLTSIHRPLVYSYKQAAPELTDHTVIPRKDMSLTRILTPFKYLTEKDVFITLLFGSTPYSVWRMVGSSTSRLFQERFGLNDLQTGLAFIPIGIGSMLGTICIGYVMDYNYKIVERQYRLSKNIPADVFLNKKDLNDFPTEKSRLRSIWPMVLIHILSTGVYGFSLSLNILALPLILQFCIGFTSTAVSSINSALLIDLFPLAGASANAVNNLIRCSIGGAGVAVVQIAIDRIGAGFTFLALACVTAAASLLLAVEWRFGQRWRMEREDRLRAQERREKSDLERSQKKSECKTKQTTQH